MANWEDNGDTCPNCGNECQNLVEVGEDGYDWNLAERCQTCRWIVRFDNDDLPIKAERY